MHKKVSFSNIVRVQTYQVYNWNENKACTRQADHSDMIHIEEEEEDNIKHKTCTDSGKKDKIKATAKMFAGNCSSLSEK